jgi:hypothetical protein
VYVSCEMVKEAVLAVKRGTSTSQVLTPLAPIKATPLVAPTKPTIIATTTPPKATMPISLVIQERSSVATPDLFSLGPLAPVSITDGVPTAAATAPEGAPVASAPPFV